MEKKEKKSNESGRNERQVHIMIPEKLYLNVKLLAAVTETSLSDILRDSLKESLTKKVQRHKSEIEALVLSLKSDE